MTGDAAPRACLPHVRASNPPPSRRAKSAVRAAITDDLKAARRRLYATTKAIDALLAIADDAELARRAEPLLAALRALHDV